MSTINFKFINKLIKFGLRAMIFFYQTQWEKLQEQFLIFLNLPATHNLLHLHNLPKLIGGNRDILGDLMDSDDDEDTVKDDNNEKDDNRDEVLLYNVRVLIQYLITRSLNNDFELRPEQIGLLHNCDDDSNWFKLRSIYLKSQDYKPWLLLLGIAKLMESYFELKVILQQTSNDPNVSFASYSILGQHIPNKRQKLGIVGDSLIQSNSVLDFCNRLIHSKSSSDETQALGLKLMIFHFENSKLQRNSKLSKYKSQTSLSSDSKTESYENGETSLLDANQTTFDFMVSTRDDPAIDRNVVFKNILGTFDNNKLSFWSILTSRSMINDEIRSERTESIKSSYIAPILKLSLLLIKQKDTSPIACSLIFLILYHRSLTTKLNQLVDDSILTQLETLIDLSEINGPFNISHESFQFWYAMNKLAIEVNLSKKDLLSQRIQDWVFAKWEISFQNNSNSIDQLYYGFEDFIFWLSGNSFIYNSKDDCLGIYEGDLNEVLYFTKNYQELESFLFLSKMSNQSIHTHENGIKIQSIVRNNRLEVLLSRIIESFTAYNNENSTSRSSLQWLLMISKISEILRPLSLFNDSVKQIDYQFSIGMESLKQLSLSNEEAGQLVEVLNKEIPTFFKTAIVTRDSFISNFPYDELLDVLKAEYRNVPITPHRNNAFDGLEKEFAEVRESSTPPSSGTGNALITLLQSKYKPSRTLEALKFTSTIDKMMKVDKEKQFVHMIEYAESLTTENLLPAVSFIIDNVLIDEEIHNGYLIRLIRLIGERLLSDQEVERSEFVLVVVSRLLSKIVPTLSRSLDASFSKDCYDICGWLIQCGTKDLILTEASTIEYCKFLLEFLICNDEKEFSNNEIRSSLFDKFSKSTNNIKFHLCDAFIKLLQASPAAKQAMVYNELFQRFADPQQSVETGGTYAIFFTKLSEASSQILYSSIFNLLECSRFPFFIPYLEMCLDEFRDIMKLNNPHDLFKSMKFEILRCWWQYDAIHQFPFVLFGYTDLQSFYRFNYRELISVALSTKLTRKDAKPGAEFIEQLANIKHSDSKALVCESLSLIVPLAYTKEGIRNDIFEIILNYLGDSMKSEFTKKLSLITLEIIKFSDMSQESHLRDSFPGSDSARLLVSDAATSVIEKPGELSISFNASVELLRKLVSKYGSAEDNFWNVKRVYFLIRRVSIKFKYTSSEDQMILLLRKFKFILIMGGLDVLDLEISSLVVGIICPLLNRQRLVFDIVLILRYFKDLFHHKYDMDRSIPLVTKIMESLFAVEKPGQNLSELLDYLCYFTTNIDGNESLQKILECANDILSGKTIFIDSSVIEQCLEELSSESLEANIIIRLISRLFDHVDTFHHEGSKIKVVEALLRIERTELEKFSKSFKLWISEYLSVFYLSGGAREKISAFDMNEYSGIPVEEFDKEITYFNYAFKKLVEYTYSSDVEAASCAESVLGVLVGKFNVNKREILKYLSFNQLYNQYGNHLLEIDFHTCVLLNDRLDVDYLGDDLRDLVGNLENFLQSEIHIWTTRLYLAILQELAPFSSIAPLLSIFVINVHVFAKDLLPELVCFYLALKKESAEANVTAILSEFIKLNSSNRVTNRIFLRIVTLIRIGAKKGLQSFSTVLSNINLVSFYKLAAENKHFKTSMMLFEDSINLDNPKKALMDNYETLQFVYESIDDKDLLYGLPERIDLQYAISMASSLGSSEEQLEYNCGAFDTDVALEGDSRNSEIIKSMSANGFLGVSRLLQKTINLGTNNSEPYEWSWKLSKWDLPSTVSPRKENEVIYNTMKQIHDYPSRAKESCQSALLNILDQHAVVFRDNLSVKEFKSNGTSWLKTMAIIYSVSNIFSFEGDEVKDLLVPFKELTRWFEGSELDLTENILLARKAAFQLVSEQSLFSKLSAESLWIGALNELVRYNDITRVCKQQQKMISSTMLIDRICSTKFVNASEGIRRAVKGLSSYQTAQTLWSQGNTSVPVLILKELYNDGGISLDGMSVNKCLMQAMIVTWMCESREELASTIMDKYVLPTADMTSSTEDLEEQSKVFRLLAHFCELQCKSRTLVEQIDNLEKRIGSKQRELEEIKQHYGKTSVSEAEKRSTSKYYKRVKLQLQLEIKDLNLLTESRQILSNKAVEYYLRSISVNDYMEEDLDKFFALWLEQSNNEELNRRIQTEVLSLATHKFISWAAQLVSRLTSDTSEFQIILKELIFDMSLEHPHHVLYLLISLRKHGATAQEESNPVLIYKCKAAESIWDRLLNKNSSFVETTLLPIERFCDQCIQIAEFKIPRAKTLNISKLNVANYWMNELPPIPPPTITLKVDYTLKYDKMPVLSKIDTKLAIASSGLSLPKIATFILSDGSQHKILLKHGTDDLRQDSIMEQVFSKVNNIFSRDKESNKRNLRIRTYNAIPLGPRSGIIEFVPNSIALMDILKPYHEPRDQLSYDTARQMMKMCQTRDKSIRIHEYQKICSKVKPVLRLFFEETFLTPDSWFESRIRYTHGVGTTSIVGYILGLGDRHCNNILLDKHSGEPIHIDLGVAFDQGKNLPIPETVPFRLSRDIVDGFGVTGVEGVFKKSCEHTFRVLKKNKDHIISILDVLRWDPLYSWSLSPIRKKRLQQEETAVGMLPEEDGSEAGRAVSTVSDKLKAGGLSVEAAVRELVQEASSPHNLALIFSGWSPFY
ncbi:uncharacterized protein J8A68_002578 [[Candida] subhashii]|uniref:Serine/threonine-protein kinase TEL1 n=1 Tax=[Candida] subhashii TaxID=561895 RepID=A0A8J5UXV6_9ASCO|nr:uncharacterized protein J8A68_002578 [[Candida] subhashii]KAG7663890.1 hypothetical protein J8A68_002578 [[Candida] subhashii]